MNCINRIIRILGRPLDGYGGLAILAKRLDIHPNSCSKWYVRGWIPRVYAKQCAELVNNEVIEDEILAEAKLYDKRLRANRKTISAGHIGKD